MFSVAYHRSHDHLCFQGNTSVIWIGTDFKRRNRTVWTWNCCPLACEHIGYWYSLSVSHTHTASALTTLGLKKPSEEGWNKYICTFFFGSRGWQVKTKVSQFGCSAIYWSHILRSTPHPHHNTKHLFNTQKILHAISFQLSLYAKTLSKIMWVRLYPTMNFQMHSVYAIRH